MLMFFLSGLAACKMNVHKRCEKNVANNCGINTRDMADILKELGISGDKLSKPKKVQTYVTYTRLKLENVYHVVSISCEAYCPVTPTIYSTIAISQTIMMGIIHCNRNSWTNRKCECTCLVQYNPLLNN